MGFFSKLKNKFYFIIPLLELYLSDLLRSMRSSWDHSHTKKSLRSGTAEERISKSSQGSEARLRVLSARL